jgi:excisionase family DNA binding protein
MEKYVSTREVASSLGISLSTVYRYLLSGDLQSYRIGSRIRIKEKDIVEFLARHRRTTPNIDRMPQNELTNLRRSPIDRAKGGLKLAKVRGLTFVRNGELSRGTVYQRKMEKGKRWCINFQVKGKRVRKVIPLAQTEQEAMIALQEETRKAFEREYSLKRAPERIKFSKFKDVYLTNHAKSKKKSWQSDEKYLNAQLVPFFGEMELSEITPLHVRQFIVKRQKDGVKNSSVNRELTVLKKMLNLAIEWDYDLEKNPVTKECFFSEEQYRRKRVLDSEEEKKLYEAASLHLRPILTCALSTGMRSGEILGLKWKNCDLEKRKITIGADSSKTGKERWIVVNEVLHDELLLLRKRNKGKLSNVFTYKDPRTGKLRPVKTVRRAFEMACKRAGIENFRFHDLRHTVASRLIEKGVDPVTVMNLLGHASLKTSEIYLHSSLRQMEKAVRLLENRGDEHPDMSPFCHLVDVQRKPGKRINVLFSVN